MATIGFDILPHVQWEDSDKELIKKYFTDKIGKVSKRKAPAGAPAGAGAAAPAGAPAKIKAIKEPTAWNKKTLAPVRDKLRVSLLHAQGNRCAYCRREIFEEIGHNEIDHIVSKSVRKEFTYERMNLIACCKRCNRNKGEHVVLAAPGNKGVAYPMNTHDYVWIHPYIHIYGDHINIIENIFFEIKQSTDDKLKARAEAVISACELAEVQTVELLRSAQLAAHAKTNMEAYLGIIGRYPNWSDVQVARAIRKRKSMSIFGVALLTEFVRKVRRATTKAFEDGLNDLASGVNNAAPLPLGP